MTTEDFVVVAEEIAGRDLGGLFDSWIFGETTPLPPGMNIGDSPTVPLYLHHAARQLPDAGCRMEGGGKRRRHDWKGRRAERRGNLS